jgi:fructose-bisphosphate aldolase, class I
MKAAD